MTDFDDTDDGDLINALRAALRCLEDAFEAQHLAAKAELNVIHDIATKCIKAPPESRRIAVLNAISAMNDLERRVRAKTTGSAFWLQ
jgi:hypothetical protein